MNTGRSDDGSSLKFYSPKLEVPLPKFNNKSTDNLDIACNYRTVDEIYDYVGLFGSYLLVMQWLLVVN